MQYKKTMKNLNKNITEQKTMYNKRQRRTKEDAEHDTMQEKRRRGT